MIKSEITESIKNIFSDISKDGFWIITGAAMVMHGIKTQTSDIDIGCTREVFQELINKGYSVIKEEGYPDRIQIDGCVEVLKEVKISKIEKIEGIPVASIADIVKFKKRLDRKKDRKDLALIMNHQQHIELRQKRFYDIINYCKKNIPYYKQYLKDMIPKEDACITLDKLPVVDKQEYMENQAMFLSNELSMDNLIWEFTSGSTGQPLKICKSKEERIIQGWMLQTQRRENGLDIGNCIMIRFHNFVNTFDNESTDILMEPTIANNQIYFPVLFFNNKNVSKLCELLKSYDTAWFYGTPSQIYKICNLLNDVDFPINKITYIELFGEVLFKHQKELIQTIFTCPIRNMYGCHEIWAIAYECSCGNLHILENNVILEILDEEGKGVGYNQEGEIVLTSLIQKSMPFIRYKIGDRGKIKKSECLCGRTSDVLELSAARVADDIVMEDGRRISSIVFLHILMLVNQDRILIKQFQIYQRNFKKFEIFIVPSIENDKKNIESIFKKVLFDVLKENVELEFIYRDDIVVNSKSGKVKYFFPLESEIQMRSEK